jgi:hypothetical protein
MTTTPLQRQFIRDASGNPIGVILPLEEYMRVALLLGDRDATGKETALLDQIEYAARDPLFLADLRETMAAYETVDAQWWEREE